VSLKTDLIENSSSFFGICLEVSGHPDFDAKRRADGFSTFCSTQEQNFSLRSDGINHACSYGGI